MTATKKLFTITVRNPNGRRPDERLRLHFTNQKKMHDRAFELRMAGYRVTGAYDYPVARDPDHEEALETARALLGEAR